MSRETMIQVLKARKLSVHGAYIYHLDIPAILSLASAYATDRITRKVFFDTLDLFVQHTGRSSDHPQGIKAHHLTMLGIPAQDAQKLPLISTRRDIWTVAGLFNGIIDMEDFDLLYSSDKKGLFLQRHFPGMPAAAAPNLFSPQIVWSAGSLLVREWIRHSPELEKQIAPACAELESGRDFYDPIQHYMLRLTAADKKSQAVSELGPFRHCEEMKALFHDIFQVVEPNYQPTINWRQDLEHFRFVEPTNVVSKGQLPDKGHAGTGQSSSQRGGCRLPCNLV